MSREPVLDAGTDAPAGGAASDARDQPLVDSPSGGRNESLPVVSLEDAGTSGRFRWRTAGRLLGLLRPSKWRMVGAVAATCAFAALNVAAPKLLGDATDVVVDGRVGGSSTRTGLGLPAGWRLPLMYVGASRLQLDPGNPDRPAVQRAHVRAAGARWRTNCTCCRPAISEEQRRGDVLSRATNDVDNISQALNQLLNQLIMSVLMLSGALAMMLWLSPAAGPDRRCLRPGVHASSPCSWPGSPRRISPSSGGAPAS